MIRTDLSDRWASELNQGDVRLRAQPGASRAYRYAETLGKLSMFMSEDEARAAFLRNPIPNWIDLAAGHIKELSVLLAERVQSHVSHDPDAVDYETFAPHSEDHMFDLHLLLCAWHGVEEASMVQECESHKLDDAAKEIESVSRFIQTADQTRRMRAASWEFLAQYRNQFPENSQIRLWWHMADYGPVHHTFLELLVGSFAKGCEPK